MQTRTYLGIKRVSENCSSTRPGCVKRPETGLRARVFRYPLKGINFSPPVGLLPLMILGLGLLWQVLPSTVPLFSQFAQYGGGSMDDFPFPFQYVEVDRAPDHMRQNVKVEIRPNPVAKRHGFHMPGSQPLAEAPPSLRERAPIPAYLPPNIRREEALIREYVPSQGEGRSTVILRYPGPSDQPAVSLTIMRSTAPPRDIWPVPVFVQRGFVHSVVVPPLQGYIIRGTWAAKVDPVSDQGDVSWEERMVTSLVFLLGEDVITVLGRPAHAFSEEELIAVALSLLSAESRSTEQGFGTD
jgi:hypothetical protein